MALGMYTRPRRFTKGQRFDVQMGGRSAFWHAIVRKEGAFTSITTFKAICESDFSSGYPQHP